MECQTKIYNKKSKEYEIIPKRRYRRTCEARRRANEINLKPTQIYKVVHYKCEKCSKIHLGRSNEIITKDYRIELRTGVVNASKPKFNPNINYNVPVQKEFKILGKIILPK